ncbi:TPA: helix-turn-helix domain-containing protein [Enterococcus faecalis]|uniref:helix-turn-helix domain-containing protein n=1 Tax=Enterococcus faecalis TaxID=1351 RepID=UPI0027D9CB5C|nr:helix-turn-helix transcriptional regulator [Enterococcus faecalis]MDQ4499524.1 helix-turn-helix transcriptional regulator [Enterococcus faecalis]
MFGLLKPDKEKVGNRLKMIKDELELSFTEYGNRLGLKKPTISSYVQGYTLLPIEIAEKVSKLSEKPLGWFYFGMIEDYIRDYLSLRGYNKILKDHPEVVSQIKEIFLTDEYKNIGWENEVGYPEEVFIDDCFAEIRNNLLSQYITEVVSEKVENAEETKSLSTKEKQEWVMYISADIKSYNEITLDIEYGDKKKIENIAEKQIQSIKKDESINFNDYYLIGKLINILNDNTETEYLISDLSKMLTDKHFSSFFGGEELIKVFQSMRPALIKLYAEKSDDEMYDWFEK